MTVPQYSHTTDSVFVLEGNLYADIHEIYTAFVSNAMSEPECYKALVKDGELIQKYPTHTEKINIIEILYTNPTDGIKTLNTFGITPVLRLEVDTDTYNPMKYFTARP